VVIEIDSLPQLRAPVLVVALAGWVDAGLAGSGSVAFLQEQLEAARAFGRIDLGDLMDLQQTRPTVHLVDGVSREIDWPEITLTAGRLGRDVVLCSGPEPSLRWRAVLGELVDVALQLGVTEAFTVGGIPAMASHRRPTSVLATGTDEALVERAGAWRQDYSGPTGAQSVLQVMLGDAGIPTLALWAQVPHYAAAMPYQDASDALVKALARHVGLAFPAGTLAEDAKSTQARLEELVGNNDEHQAMVRQLEAQYDAADHLNGPLPTGDDLAAEVEQFLRDQE